MVVGAGPAGVELASTVAERLGSKAHVQLVSAGPALPYSLPCSLPCPGYHTALLIVLTCPADCPALVTTALLTVLTMPAHYLALHRTISCPVDHCALLTTLPCSLCWPVHHLALLCTLAMPSLSPCPHCFALVLLLRVDNHEVATLGLALQHAACSQCVLDHKIALRENVYTQPTVF